MAEKKAIEILFSDDSLQDLSEDFKTKATVVFESAVASQITEEKKIIEESFEQKLEEEIKAINEDIESKIDSYLTYVAEEWVEENKLALESGIRSEIAESFMGGLKDLFMDSNVDIPENKIDIVAEMADDLESTKKALDEEIDKNISLVSEIDESNKVKIILELTDGLADTQVDKVCDLAEMVDFTDEDYFASRIKSIVEMVEKGTTDDGKGTKKVGKEEDEDDKDDKDGVDKKKKDGDVDEMKSYVDALSMSMNL